MMKDFGTITCSDCGSIGKKSGPTQRYCAACSEKRDIQRKRLWARQHPPKAQTRDNSKIRFRERRGKLRAAAAAVSKAMGESIGWDAAAPIAISWMTRVSIPFSYAASKNHIYTMRRVGHRVLRGSSAAYRAALADAVRNAIGDQRIAHNKLWLDILVQKPNHKGDAVNVVNLVCDAVKDATGLDDRWFCIRRLDWQVVRSDPRLFVGVAQEATEDCQVCALCGGILPLCAFRKNRNGRLGVARECRSCLAMEGIQ